LADLIHNPEVSKSLLEMAERIEADVKMLEEAAARRNED